MGARYCIYVPSDLGNACALCNRHSLSTCQQLSSNRDMYQQLPYVKVNSASCCLPGVCVGARAEGFGAGAEGFGAVGGLLQKSTLQQIKSLTRGVLLLAYSSKPSHVLNEALAM